MLCSDVFQAKPKYCSGHQQKDHGPISFVYLLGGFLLRWDINSRKWEDGDESPV